MFNCGLEISFGYQSFKWRNLASNNAGVTVIIVGVSRVNRGEKRLFQGCERGENLEVKTDKIGPYLIPRNDVIVVGRVSPLSALPPMDLGNAPYDGGHLIVTPAEMAGLYLSDREKRRWLRPLYGSAEIIAGLPRYCIWIEDSDLADALETKSIRERIDLVRKMRLASSDAGTQAMASKPHQFREMNWGRVSTIAVPLVSSENREYLTPDLIGRPCSMTNKSYAIYDSDIWCMSILSSKLHLCWIAAVCGKLETRLSYSNKMGWHTFPVPPLTDQNKADLTRCAEDILLAREAHFAATIAELYDPDKMPADLREAHERNDEVLERIYIGRRFKNDTERLEKLFELYTQMVAKQASPRKPAAPKTKRADA